MGCSTVDDHQTLQTSLPIILPFALTATSPVGKAEHRRNDAAEGGERQARGGGGGGAARFGNFNVPLASPSKAIQAQSSAGLAPSVDLFLVAFCAAEKGKQLVSLSLSLHLLLELTDGGTVRRTRGCGKVYAVGALPLGS